MIEISEIIPKKLSGRSSLRVQFPYNQDIVNIVKSYSPAVWHKTETFWELPSYFLASLLDTLTQYDDIKLSLLRDDENEEISNLLESEISSFKYKPFSHQVTGINFLLKQKKSLLLDGCGVGKSLQIMYYAETLKQRGLIDHCLIICGVDSLRSNWKSEIREFSNLSCMVLGEKITKTGKVTYETISRRVEILKQPISDFFVIINSATLVEDKIIDAILKGPNKFGLIAVDECQKFVSKSSQRSSNLLKLKSDFKIAASGTLITSTPLSAYVPLSFTENDHATLTNYKAQYCVFGGFNNSQVIGSQHLEFLKDEIDSCSIRRTFDMIKSNMPKKTVEYELIEMSEEHKKFYEAIKEGVKEEADKIDLKSTNLLSLTIRLRQATGAPTVLTSQDILSSKVERCVEVAQDLLDSGEKVVIFATFIESVNQLAKYLAKYNPVLCTGKINSDLMQREIETFRNSGDLNLIIATHGKLGVGYSMPECHYALMLDTPWTYSDLEQSSDRIYRVTSDQPVFIKIFACKDTIDERVKEIVETKKDLSDYLIDGKLSDSLSAKMKNIILEL